MSNKTTVYLCSDNQQLKDWANLFCENLSMISTQFLGTSEKIDLTLFSGELTTSDKHIFILTANETDDFSAIEKSENNLFQLHLSPTPFNKIPSFLHNAPMFEFYDIDMASNQSVWSNLDVSTGTSWGKLLDFTKSLFDKYKKDKHTIYLAKTSVNQVRNRELLKRDLLNQGYRVIPEIPLNTSNIEVLEQQINSLTNAAELSIHIFGNDMNEVDDKVLEIVEFQNKVAKNNASLQRLIWLPTDVRLDKINAEKISVLRKDLELLKGAEFVEAPLELFKSLVYQKIEHISFQNVEKNKALYLIYDNNENQDIKQIKAEIEKNKLGVLVVNNLDEHPLVNHKNNLKNSNGIIIYYDGSNSNWIENILNDIIKAPKYRNNKQINSIGIISNSKLSLKPELESYKLEKIDISNQDQLETFIQNIDK